MYRTVPPVTDLIDGSVDAQRIRRGRVEDLLRRPIVNEHAVNVDEIIRDRTVIITGGGGAVLARYLQPLLNGEVMAVDPKLDMRLYNVQGYRKFGQHLWGRGASPTPAPPVA